jgi:hypothetical protein
MKRWLWAIIALVATVASAGRVTTFAWTNGADWPEGTTVELCSNGICAVGLTGTQHTLDVPIQPGEKFDSKARSVAPTGYQCGDPLHSCPYSEWGILVQTLPVEPVAPWAWKQQIEDHTMAVEQSGSAYLGDLYSASVAVVVPSDANIAIIYGKHYALSTGAPTIGASSATLVVRSGDTGDRPIVDIWYIVNPTIGSQTLTYGAAQGFSDTYYMGAVFFKGVDTANPIASYNSSSDNTDITGLTAPAGSMMFGCSGGSYSTPTVTDNSQTQLILENSHGFGAALRADMNGFYFTGTSQNAAALTINPSGVSAATGLPRRALDGPFYGSTRGPVR